MDVIGNKSVLPIINGELTKNFDVFVRIFENSLWTAFLPKLKIFVYKKTKKNLCIVP